MRRGLELYFGGGTGLAGRLATCPFHTEPVHGVARRGTHVNWHSGTPRVALPYATHDELSYSPHGELPYSPPGDSNTASVGKAWQGKV